MNYYRGIDETHPLFEGRAKRGVDFVEDRPPPNGDPNGHGTHVAGKIAMYSESNNFIALDERCKVG